MPQLGCPIRRRGLKKIFNPSNILLNAFTRLGDRLVIVACPGRSLLHSCADIYAVHQRGEVFPTLQLYLERVSHILASEALLILDIGMPFFVELSDRLQHLDCG